MSASGGKAAVHPWLVRRIKQVAYRMSALIESGHSNAWKLEVLTGSFRPKAAVRRGAQQVLVREIPIFHMRKTLK